MRVRKPMHNAFIWSMTILIYLLVGIGLLKIGIWLEFFPPAITIADQISGGILISIWPLVLFSLYLSS